MAKVKESLSLLATFKAKSKSAAVSKSNPRNRFGFSLCQTLRLAALCHDWITAETYYDRR